MGRREYQRVKTGLTLGINQQLERASFEECADALNVWAPNGKLEQRPGYVGISSPTIEEMQTFVVTLGSAVVIKEDPINTFTTTHVLGQLPAGSRWYYGFSTYSDTTNVPYLGVLILRQATSNTNDMVAGIEYWNGSSWVYLANTESDDTTTELLATKHLNTSSTDSWFKVPWPQDLAQTTVNGLTKYFFRFTMMSVNGSATLSVGTEVSAIVNIAEGVDPPATFFIGRALFSSTSRYIGRFVEVAAIPNQNVFSFNISTLRGFDASDQILQTITGQSVSANLEPATMAVVAQFNQAFIATGNKVSAFSSNPVATDGSDAQVESRDFAVGQNAPYDPNFIAQLNAFPKANYITFFQGRLWFSGIDGEPYTIRWGAPQPFHNVLPTISAEPIISADDGSPVTGMAPLGEQLVVFKENSIYVMVDSGLDGFGLAKFTPVRRVSGIGCNANSSIQQIRGELFFSSKNGLYAFNGVTVRKLTEVSREGEAVDRLKDFWQTIASGRAANAAGIDYKKRSVYLLALPTDGSYVNNKVLAYDYEHNSFWIWNNIEVQGWIQETDALYFYDWRGRIFQFDVGHQDNGAAIACSALTQRVGFDDRFSQTCREVEIAASNLSQSTNIEVLPNDAATGQTGNTLGTIVLTDVAEKNFDAAIFNVDNFTTTVQRKRRLEVKATGQYYQVKLSHAVKGTPFSMGQLLLGHVVLGAR